MGKRILFIFNPISGRAQLKNKLMEIINLFVENGCTVTVHPTQGVLDAKRIAIEEAGDYDLLVCSGGDGTVNEVVDGLMEAEKKPVLGYIPSGTVNDFASSMHIPKNMMKAAETILHGEVFPFDVGGFNEEYFSYIAAFGLFTNVAYQTPQQSKNTLGRMAYILEGAKQLFDIQSYHLLIEHDGEQLEGNYIFGLITNSTSVGGFKGYRGKDVKLDDGLFEVTLIKQPENPIELQMVITSLMKKEINTDLITSFLSSSIKITCENEVPWTLDGENGGNRKEVLIQNHQRALRIMIEPKKLVERVDAPDEKLLEE